MVAKYVLGVFDRNTGTTGGEIAEITFMFKAVNKKGESRAVGGDVRFY